MEQVSHVLETQKHRLCGDEQEMHGAKAFVVVDTGPGQMGLEGQHGKKFSGPIQFVFESGQYFNAREG
ncbi:MAG: hypothetical protein K6T55_10620 [Syntrophobacterales bacterium]|nr:hypothetical protein [Syntrophobacterales bacterium]